MKLKESKLRWIAGLSNGETLIEGEGIVSRIDGEDSPWWKLQKYLEEKDLTINSFYLASGGQHFNLPNGNIKFGGVKPLRYNCFRRVRSDGLVGDTSKDEFYTCAEAIYDGFKIQLYVDENDLNKSWVNMVEG